MSAEITLLEHDNINSISIVADVICFEYLSLCGTDFSVIGESCIILGSFLWC